MCLWVAALARLDLNIHALGRLPLYSLGIILTFNLGRDITLITLYPFLFGALAVWWLDRRRAQVAKREKPASMTAQPVGRPRPASGRPLPFVRRATSGGFVKRKSSGSAAVHPKTDLK